MNFKSLVQEYNYKGWQAWLFPVRISCKGLPAKSTWLFSALGRKEQETSRLQDGGGGRTGLMLDMEWA